MTQKTTMKKAIYKVLYLLFVRLSNLFNSRLLSKSILYLGTALLILSSSCSKDNNADLTQKEIKDEGNKDDNNQDDNNQDDSDFTCYLVASP